MVVGSQLWRTVRSYSLSNTSLLLKIRLGQQASLDCLVMFCIVKVNILTTAVTVMSRHESKLWTGGWSVTHWDPVWHCDGDQMWRCCQSNISMNGWRQQDHPRLDHMEQWHSNSHSHLTSHLITTIHPLHQHLIAHNLRIRAFDREFLAFRQNIQELWFE